jgi:hypothetical protein
VSLEEERFRVVVAEGENLDSRELPALERPYAVPPLVRGP